jgi:hypothetical protein
MYSTSTPYFKKYSNIQYSNPVMYTWYTVFIKFGVLAAGNST